MVSRYPGSLTVPTQKLSTTTSSSSRESHSSYTTSSSLANRVLYWAQNAARKYDLAVATGYSLAASTQEFQAPKP